MIDIYTRVYYNNALNLFIQNKYTNIYFEIINSRLNRSLDDNFYKEKHHIIPRCLGGIDENNIISLSAREHYICHLLLVKMTDGINKSKMAHALHRISYSKNVKLNSRQYSKVRKIHSENMKQNHPSKNKKWRDSVSSAVKLHWKNNNIRKQNLINTFTKFRTENYEKFCKQQSISSKLAIKAYRVKNANKIEYKGCYYYSLQHLKNETGVSSHLYKKYYLKGIDPEFRVGCSGPIIKKGGSVN